MNNKEINVVFSSDDNYAQHMGVAMYSLLKNNQIFEKITFYIIDNNISKNNRKKILTMVSNFKNGSVKWIDFSDWKDKLILKMGKWTISISSYARLFIGSMLNKNIDRVLYLDCDMIVLSSLYDLWNMDMHGRVVGAVQDSVNDIVKESVNLTKNKEYFNAGMMLIDLNKWRELEIEKQCISFIQRKNGNVVHHDQGSLNGVISGNFKKLPLNYNLMTIHYIWDRKKIIEYYEESSNFYKEEEIEKAKQNPCILHFTPSFTSRPWTKECKHPLKNEYWEYLAETPWKGAKKEKSGEKWYVRIINWKYRKFGV